MIDGTPWFAALLDDDRSGDAVEVQEPDQGPDFELSPQQMVQVEQFLASGTLVESLPGVLGVDEGAFQDALDAGARGIPKWMPLFTLVKKAETTARVTAEIDLRSKNPRQWLQLQSERKGKRGSTYRRLIGLPGFAEIHERLSIGQSPGHVARVIKEDMRLCPDIPVARLENMLVQYRAEAIGVPLDPDRTPEEERLSEELRSRLTQSVDVCEHLMWLSQVQRERVLLMFTSECGSKRLRDSGHREVEVLAKTLGALGDFQLKTGLIRRAPLEVGVTVTPGGNGEVDQAMALAQNAESLERARQATKFLLSAMSKNE